MSFALHRPNIDNNNTRVCTENGELPGSPNRLYRRVTLERNNSQGAQKNVPPSTFSELRTRESYGCTVEKKACSKVTPSSYVVRFRSPCIVPGLVVCTVQKTRDLPTRKAISRTLDRRQCFDVCKTLGRP